MTGPPETAPALRHRFVAGLRRAGVLTRPDVIAAFDTVPREAFVAHGFHASDGSRVIPADSRFLATVYRDDVLVTKVVDGTPVSSSSQPSLMAVMIESLAPVPGMRVLEIGAGTGYNAALLAAVGARVTSIDVRPDVVEQARAALAAAAPTPGGAAGAVGRVEVRHGDGYLGAPAGGPYDRVIVTVGVAGLSPHWFDQLAPGGFAIVPVGHCGNHPVLLATRAGARVISSAGFMSAAGPLSARYPDAHPVPVRHPLGVPSVRLAGPWPHGLDVRRYHDLWFAVGVWDRRVTFAGMAQSPGPGGCALVDPDGDGGALLGRDGTVLATGSQADRYAVRARELRDRWVRLGEPVVTRWRTRLLPDGDPAQPILVPREWTLGQA